MIATTVFAQSLSNFTCKLWMMRGGTLLILGHGVIGQGQLCPPARGCYALCCLVVPAFTNRSHKTGTNALWKNICRQSFSEWYMGMALSVHFFSRLQLLTLLLALVKVTVHTVHTMSGLYLLTTKLDLIYTSYNSCCYPWAKLCHDFDPGPYLQGQGYNSHVA